MKSFLKGLRYIIHKFDSKEPEMKIGKPTDVKHVAHIGWDGPSTALPSWMSEFKSAPECSSNPKQEDNNLKSTGSKDSNNFSHPKQEKAVRHHPELPRPTRRHHRSSSNGGDPLTADLTTRDGQVPPKPSRRRRSSSGESSSDLTKPSRKQHGDEQNKDTAGVPKKSRRRKSKSTVNPNGSIESDHSIKSKSPRDPNRRKSADKLPQLQETNT